MPSTPPFITSMLIPTGVGASIGGFAGDAAQAMALLASVSDTLLTHPNVANAAVFSALPANTLYVEGYALDRFFTGDLRLQPVRSNRVGVVFDARIQPDMLTLHRNVMGAVSSVYGVTIAGETLTDAPLELSMALSASGVSTGGLLNPQVLYDACERLIHTHQVSAIAICAELPTIDDPEVEQAYEQGNGVDPIGGLEAILSHSVVARFGLPCAHAPVFPRAIAQPAYDRLVDSRVAAEYIAPTFLPCVLQGLAHAPQLVPERAEVLPPNTLGIEDLDALVVPADTLGGIPMLVAAERGLPLIVVQNNRSVLNVTPQALWGDHQCQVMQQHGALFNVHSYAEAAGLLQALKLGLPCPQ